MATTNILFLQMGGTIDKDYPRTKLGYSFEIGAPAILPILKKIKPTLNFDYEIKTICQKDSQELEGQDRCVFESSIQLFLFNYYTYKCSCLGNCIMIC